MNNQLYNRLINRFNDDLVKTSVGYMKANETKDEITLYVPVKNHILFFIFSIVVSVGILLLIWLISGLVFSLIGPAVAANVIIMGITTLIIGFLFMMHVYFNLTISRIEYVKFQKYLYFKSVFGIVTTAPVKDIKTELMEEDSIVNLKVNDFDLDIFWDTIEDENIKENLTKTLGVQFNISE